MGKYILQQDGTVKFVEDAGKPRLYESGKVVGGEQEYLSKLGYGDPRKPTTPTRTTPQTTPYGPVRGPATTERVTPSTTQFAGRQDGLGVSELTTPTAQPSPLDSYKKSTNFINILKQAIQRKQDYNKDIQSSRDYWRTQQRDPMTFTDERLRLLSPAQQQSLREKRYATAGAHLTGLREEEKYRETRIEDIISEMTDLQEAASKDTDDAAIAEGRRLENLKKMESLGFDVTAEQVYGSYIDMDKLRVGDRQGGSASWRNNNPGNIKYRDENNNITRFAQALLNEGIQIREGSKATDGGSFISFPDEDTGRDNMMRLLTGGLYADLTVEKAMRRWSNKGYGADVLSKELAGQINSNTLMRDLTPKQVNMLKSDMEKREQWSEGKILKTAEAEGGIDLSDSAKDKILKLSGVKESDLGGDLSYDSWKQLEAAGREATFEIASEEADKLKVAGKEPKNVRAALIRGYSDVLTSSEINSIITSMGVRSIGGLTSEEKWTD